MRLNLGEWEEIPMAMILGKYKGNDIELCRTTNNRVGQKTAMALMEERIPFTKNEKHVPFYKRDEYNGADRVWIIKINPSRYGQARRTIDKLDIVFRQRLLLSNF